MAKKAQSVVQKKAARKTVARKAATAVKPKAVPARGKSKKIAAKTAGRGAKPSAGRQAPAAFTAPSAAVQAARQAEAKQADRFDTAVRLFQSRKFGRARLLFEKAVGGPNVGLNHRAGVYLRICKEQSARAKPRLTTSEEHYHYAVQLINDGRLEEAGPYLNKALRMDRNAAHALYALSVLKVMKGDLPGAFEALKKSIRIDPQNRILARSDSDLATVARTEPFKSLLIV